MEQKFGYHDVVVKKGCKKHIVRVVTAVIQEEDGSYFYETRTPFGDVATFAQDELEEARY